MSVIAGLWRRGGGSPGAECERMLGAMHMRTAVFADRWEGDGVALGHKLVETVPEDRHDQQPVRLSGGRYVVAADLRLDNREDLARDLSLSPGDLARLPDSALAAHALERWGEAAFQRFVGVFAIAAWEVKERRLLLARDFLGLRPLFYHEGAKSFAFASAPGGLHALAEVPKGPDYETMAETLALILPRSSRSAYQDVHRVLPGHHCIVEDGRVRQVRYWRPSLTPLRLKRHEDYVEGLREHLDRAVAAQLRGAGEHVGAHLSSGLDSSAVTTSAARLMALSGGRVAAFTACPREGYGAPGAMQAAVDEGPLAALTAARYSNIEHVIVRTGARSALDELERSSTLFGGPLFNLCNQAWLDAVNDAAQRRDLKVLLVGTYGNASLSYAGGAALSELFAAGRRKDWLRLARGLRRRGRMRWRGIVMNTVAPWIPGPLYAALLGMTGRGEPDFTRYTALRPEVLARLQAAQDPSDDGADPARSQSLDRWSRPFRSGTSERLATLAGDLGPFNKGVLGWWGLDLRDPTADRRLVEFSLRIPSEQFAHDGAPKALIRNALADRVPAEVLNSPYRATQAADWHEDLSRVRERLEAEVERIARSEDASRLIDVERLQGLVDNWPDGGWDSAEAAADYRFSLLRAISAANFMRKAAGSNV